MAEEGPLSQADIDALTAGLLGDAASAGVDANALRPDAEAILEQASSVLGTLLNRHAAVTARDIREADAAALGEGLDDQGLIVRLALEQGLPGELCLLVRKEVYDRVSGLDESLTVAFNDVDFCLRVAAAGYRNLWTPFAELIHHESVSRGRDFTPAKAKRFADEHAIMQRRWGAELLDDPYYSPHLTRDADDFSLRLR